MRLQSTWTLVLLIDKTTFASRAARLIQTYPELEFLFRLHSSSHETSLTLIKVWVSEGWKIHHHSADTTQTSPLWLSSGSFQFQVFNISFTLTSAPFHAASSLAVSAGPWQPLAPAPFRICGRLTAWDIRAMAEVNYLCSGSLFFITTEWKYRNCNRLSNHGCGWEGIDMVMTTSSSFTGAHTKIPTGRSRNRIS